MCNVVRPDAEMPEFADKALAYGRACARCPQRWPATLPFSEGKKCRSDITRRPHPFILVTVLCGAGEGKGVVLMVNLWQPLDA